MPKVGISGPLQTDLEAETMTTAVCYRLKKTKRVFNILTLADSGSGWVVVTEADHNMQAGDSLFITDAVGLTGINDAYYVIRDVGSNFFYIDPVGVSGTYTGSGKGFETHGYTSLDRDLELGGVLYKTASGVFPSALRTGNNNVINNAEVGTLGWAQFSVSEEDIHKGLLDHAEVEIFMVNYEDLSKGKVILMTGHTGSIKMYRDNYVIEIASLADRLTDDTIQLVTPYCRHDLGDEFDGLVTIGCTFDRSTLAATGTVTTANDNREFIDTARTEATDYWKGGLLTWTAGGNRGVTVEVQSYDSTTDTITLFEDMVAAIQVGDQYSVTPGCDKSKDTCINLFDNVVDFDGFDFLPGPSELSNVGGQRNSG